MNPRQDARAIWNAGVDAVRSDRLVERHVRCAPDRLQICGESFSLADLDRIEIVGCGKAGAGMTRGLLSALHPIRTSVSISGWVNVPEDCVEHAGPVTLHAARPAGINEPTEAGVAGAEEILRRLDALTQRDLCVVLISGGGSALLPAPVPQITLKDKQSVTRLLAGSGATINELNTVRSQLSRVKGGGLVRHCRAGQLIALIISDVIADPLDIIASGPTTPTSGTPADAWALLKKYDPEGSRIPPAVARFLREAVPLATQNRTCHVSNHIIGSNSVALAAAKERAEQLGYQVLSMGSENAGEAAVHGKRLFQRLVDIRSQNRPGRPTCVLAGGETTVRLADTDKPRKGGRNQEAVLAAVAENPHPDSWTGITLLSGGTDGEDGPTDAAGALADAEIVADVRRLGIAAADYLAINDSWTFFDQAGALLRTGPTHTNVMDLAVGISMPPA